MLKMDSNRTWYEQKAKELMSIKSWRQAKAFWMMAKKQAWKSGNVLNSIIVTKIQECDQNMIKIKL